MKKYLESYQFLVMGLLAICFSLGFTSCGGDDEGTETNKNLGNGFVLTKVGISYAIIEISMNDLKKYYFDRLGVKGTSGMDLSQYGLDEETLNDVLPEFFYISISDNSDFSAANKISASKEKDKVVFNLPLEANTKYYYQIYCISPSGSYLSDGKIYNFKSNEFNKNSVTFETGDAYVKYKNSTYYNIVLGESSVVVNNVDSNESLWCGVAFSSSMNNLSEELLSDYIKSGNYGSNVDIVSYPLFMEYSHITDSSKKYGLTEASIENGQVVAKFTPIVLKNFKGIEMYYYRAYVQLGGVMYYDKIMSVSKSDR